MDPAYLSPLDSDSILLSSSKKGILENVFKKLQKCCYASWHERFKSYGTLIRSFCQFWVKIAVVKIIRALCMMLGASSGDGI